MAFWNDLNFEDFNMTYKQLKPLSYYGQYLVDNFTPFKKGQTNQANSYYQLLESVIAWEKQYPKKAKSIKFILRSINNIDHCLANLESLNIDSVNFYEIRKFILNVWKILQQVEKESFLEIEQEKIILLIKIFDKYCDTKTGFNISNTTSLKLAQTSQKINEASKNINKIHQTRHEAVSSILGKVVNGRFAIKRNSDSLAKIKEISYLSLIQKDVNFCIFDFLEDELIIELKSERTELQKEYQKEQERIKLKLLEELNKNFPIIKEAAKSIGVFDLLLAKCEFSLQNKCSIPKIVDEQMIMVNKGIHPLLDEKLQLEGMRFTPRSICLAKGTALLTGMNMGGKTVTLRMLRLFAAMVSVGMPIPAEKIEIGLFEFIYSNDKYNDTIRTGLSAFGREVKDMQFAIDKKNEFGLIFIDEIARGACPELGQSLAHSFIEEMQGSNCILLITTHYSGIKKLDTVVKWQTKGVKEELRANHTLEVDQLEQLIDYSLVQTENDYLYSDILQVARLLGLNQNVLERTEQKLSERGCQKWEN